MSLVLALDTSGGSAVGVARDARVLASRRHDDPRAQVEQLQPLVDAVLTEAGVGLGDIEQIVVGVGPGPFTGLRVGIAAAEVLALTLDHPLTGVCSLDVLARQAVAGGLVDGPFLTVSDARRGELYWARHDADGRRDHGPEVGPAADLPDLPALGPAADTLPGGRVLALDAGGMAAGAGAWVDAGRAPLYLRSPDAVQPSAPKSTLVAPPLRRRPRPGRPGVAR